MQQLDMLHPRARGQAEKVARRYAFRSNEYYLSLINWDDPQDPIRNIIIPNSRELETWGELDPSNEKAYTIMPGLEHKYHSTALMLVSDRCAGICRYCFRKRVFMDEGRSKIQDVDAAVDYIREHEEITNVLITGGDPLMLRTDELEDVVAKLRGIDHVNIIRLGTKMPVFDPRRIIDDPTLLRMIGKYSTPEKRIYIMTHFVHPRELTDTAVNGISSLLGSGALVANQMPLLRGLNDDPDVLAEHLAKLASVGAVPYYVFQCRPASGNKAYAVPIEEGYDIIEQAKSKVSGLAKRIRFAMSHASGKIEIVGKTEGFVYFKYHRAANDADSGKLLVFRSNPGACWLDDYGEPVDACGPCEPAERSGVA